VKIVEGVKYYYVTSDPQRYHRSIMCCPRLVVIEQLPSVPCTSILAAGCASTIETGAWIPQTHSPL